MSITSDVIQYFEKHADKSVSVNDIIHATKYSRQQVITAISNKKHESSEFSNRLTRVGAGIYKYKSDTMIALERNSLKHNTSSSGNMYEQIGITKNGDLILQDEDGNLFRAQELT